MRTSLCILLCTGSLHHKHIDLFLPILLLVYGRVLMIFMKHQQYVVLNSTLPKLLV